MQKVELYGQFFNFTAIFLTQNCARCPGIKWSQQVLKRPRNPKGTC